MKKSDAIMPLRSSRYCKSEGDIRLIALSNGFIIFLALGGVLDYHMIVSSNVW